MQISVVMTTIAVTWHRRGLTNVLHEWHGCFVLFVVIHSCPLLVTKVHNLRSSALIHNERTNCFYEVVHLQMLAVVLSHGVFFISPSPW